MICTEAWLGCGVIAAIFVNSLQDRFIYIDLFDIWLGPAQEDHGMNSPVVKRGGCCAGIGCLTENFPGSLQYSFS